MEFHIVTEEREKIKRDIIGILQAFDQECKNLSFKKGIYLYGSSGTGKTHFIKDILKSLDYDILQYDASDTRNKCLIENITNNQLSSNNVLNMFHRKKQKMAILMDDMEAMNNGDKGGISALIKLIRQKKTKRQKTENQTALPIICIGSYYVDKKIKELMKICNVFELKPLTEIQQMTVLQPFAFSVTQKQQIIHASHGDIRKLIYHTKRLKDNPEWFHRIALTKTTLNPDAKTIIRHLLNTSEPFEQHGRLISETDRTIVALLWHENVIDQIPVAASQQNLQVYDRILKNICFADYIDRITFQSQIWQFNEMSSLIKTMYNNHLFHKNIVDRRIKLSTEEVRFTKILTKYSTEYNNINFVFHLCNQLNMDKKDVFALFDRLRQQPGVSKKDTIHPETMDELEKRGINKLDIKRIYRFLDHTDKKEVATTGDLVDDVDLDEEDEEYMRGGDIGEGEDELLI